MSTSSLRAIVAAHPHVPALDQGVAAVVGASSLSELNDDAIKAHHVISTETSLSVYVLSRSSFGLYEATADGRRLSICIPRARWRRAALYEDPTGAQLTLEFDADRSTVNGTLTGEGALNAEVTCASYTLTESQLGPIESLKNFARAVASALNG